MTMRELVTPWVMATVLAFMGGIVMDAASWGTMGWGYRDTEDKQTTVGLWRVCNLTKERDGTTTESCIFPTEVEQDWIPKAMVMEIMAGFCGIGIFFTLIIFVFTLRLDWMRSRFILVALMAEGLLAGLFNFIGLMSFGLNMKSLGADPSYSLVFETLAVLCYFAGCAFGVCDMQKCCLQPSEELNTHKMGGGQTRLI
ncbi:hypothetical protein CAPTEDRAFT_222503 [Capitella teleta]|uniref:Claudin n=1 Tax=Capitella teleta TaxID=283909 RepID=R7TLJ9_CAPTE|nr:hypothetical protein CAPTEDRAFT_222503 [Capitella teleta]|eukprot:ELT91985.1 hypothetical protein CAPTEDRAFT_222503 [Capitella teleta]